MKIYNRLIILCLFLVVFIAGCSNQSNLNIATNINKELKKLQNVVNNLDVIDNEYISNPNFTSSNNVSKVAYENTISFNNATHTESIENNNSYDYDVNISEYFETIPLTNNTTKNNNNKPYYYLENNFKPDVLKYNPRYISSYSEENTSNNLNNYIYKIQKLYAISEDVVEANNILNLYKNNINEIINDTINNCNDISSQKWNPSKQTTTAINNYLKSIEKTRKRIKSCNGDLNNEIVNINSNNNLNIVNSIDVINSNYIRILNHINTRINYFENAIASLEQLKYLIDDCVYEMSQNKNANNISNINAYNTTTINNDSTDDDSEILNNNNNNNNTISNNNLTSDENIDLNYSDNSKQNNLSKTDNNSYNLNNNSLNNHNLPNNSIDNPNSIINQNNLNNDQNNNIYYYDNNGNLYNPNNNHFALNNNKNNTNVDTYDYNTLVDIINRGTVDNGINNLSINNYDKPVMVNKQEGLKYE